MSGAVLVSGFALLLLSMLVLEVRARWGEGRTATLGQLADAAVHPPAGRAVAVLGWLWLGWHLFVR